MMGSFQVATILGADLISFAFPSTSIHAQELALTGQGICIFFRLGPILLDSPCFVASTLFESVS